MTEKISFAFTLVAISLAILPSLDAQDASDQLMKAVSDLAQQQTQLADNQTKIDGKIADLAEAIRVARIYMSRGGGKHKPLPIPK
jgi:hypothetical protein